MRSTSLRRAVVASVSVVFVAAALAQHLSPNDAVPSVANLEQSHHTALFKDVRAGTLTIVMEKTSLFDVQRAFGGELRHEGDAGGATEWLCYAGPDAHAKPTLFWFSSGEMGGSEESILGVAQQPNPDGKVPDGCAIAPHSLTNIDFGVPGVGNTERDATVHFGPAKSDASGHFHYAAMYAPPTSKDATVTQTLVYSATAGVIVGVALTQVTSD